eukprot:jgi/Tetstr1/431114/TSEL_020830.t1
MKKKVPRQRLPVGGFLAEISDRLEEKYKILQPLPTSPQLSSDTWRRAQLLNGKDGMSWVLKLAPLLSRAKIATSGFTDAILLPAQKTLDNLREVAQSKKERQLALGKMVIRFAVEYFTPGRSCGSNIHSYLNIVEGFWGHEKSLECIGQKPSKGRPTKPAQGLET